jgi:hypothetical protein
MLVLSFFFPHRDCRRTLSRAAPSRGCWGRVAGSHVVRCAPPVRRGCTATTAPCPTLRRVEVVGDMLWGATLLGTSSGSSRTHGQGAISVSACSVVRGVEAGCRTTMSPTALRFRALQSPCRATASSVAPLLLAPSH